MARRKLAKLQEKTARLRQSERQQVAIHATCSLGDRPEEPVLVTDLGVEGCRMRSNAVGVSRSESVRLTLGDVGPIGGTLKWNKGGALGVSFDEPLDESVIARLNEAALLAESESKPQRNRQANENPAGRTVH